MRDVNARDINAGRDIYIYDQSTAGANYVQLGIDQDSIQRYPKAEVERQALRGGIIVAVGLVPSFTASFADLLGILSYFGIPRFSTIVVSLPVGLVLATLSAAILRENFNSLHYWVRSKFLKVNEGKYIEPDKFLTVNEEGDYLTYCYTAPCLYPRCMGRIVVKKLPPREYERCGAGFAALCTVADQAHSYFVDYNLVATPKDLDWRPLDPPSPNPGYRR
jgi:hypothetical protein